MHFFVQSYLIKIFAQKLYVFALRSLLGKAN